MSDTSKEDVVLFDFDLTRIKGVIAYLDFHVANGMCAPSVAATITRILYAMQGAAVDAVRNERQFTHTGDRHR